MKEKQSDHVDSKIPQVEKKKIWYSVWAGVVPTAIGFFLALGLNDVIDYLKDKETFNTMIKSIEIEANGNKEIAEDSFKPHYNDSAYGKVILRALNVETSRSLLKNTLFIRFVSNSQLEIMSKYILESERLNGFRSQYLDVRHFGMPDNTMTKQDSAFGKFIDSYIAYSDSISKLQDYTLK